MKKFLFLFLYLFVLFIGAYFNKYMGDYTYLFGFTCGCLSLLFFYLFRESDF